MIERKNISELFTEKQIEYIDYSHKQSWEDHRSTHKRFDYLLISVDAGCLFLIFEVFKLLVEKAMPIDVLLKVCAILFACSIISNLISQFCAFNVFNNILTIEQKIVFQETDNLRKLEKKMNAYSWFSKIFMWMCAISMIVAFVMLTYYLFVTF